MMRTLSLVLISLIIAFLIAGCGGQTSQFGSGMLGDDSNFGFGSSPNARSGPNKLASSFWNLETQKKAAQADEISTETEKVGDVDIVLKQISYEGERWEGNGTRVFAYFAYPTRSKGTKVAAVLHIHGASQTADKAFVKEWAGRGYAAMSVDLPGRGPSREESRSTGPDMTDDSIFSCAQSPKESWLFPATCAVMRGISYLAAQQMVDPFRIGLVGYGWGGVIALLANGVDNRVRAICSVYGTGYLADGGGYSERLKKMPDKQRKSWVGSFDPSSYLKTQNGPVLYLSATGETQYTLSNLARSYKDSSCDKRCALAANAVKLDDGVTADLGYWFDWALRSGPEFARVLLQQKGNKLSVATKGGRPAVKAVMYSRSESNGKWESTESKPEKGTFSFTVPEGSYFVSVIDDRGGVVSSEIGSSHNKNAKTTDN